MIPVSLKLTGFLSYRDPVEVDFSSFNLACISGHNGAGKSSLLDAITWVLFGEARAREKDAIINLQSETAEVIYTFSYEENLYRVQRAAPRGKTTLLEFQIRDEDDWRTLSERTMRETQARIQSVLRLDFETFTNAAFFLQGKADQFTQQNATQRKQILGNILGLETWELYRFRTAEQRRNLEKEVDSIDGRIAEINAELGEESVRKERLTELESELDRLSATRNTAEASLAAMRRVSASLEEQRKLVDSLKSQLDRAENNLLVLEARLMDRQTESLTYRDLQARAIEVEAAYEAWQAIRDELARWDALAEQFRDTEKRRSPLIEAISVEKARLVQEQVSLREQASAISDQLAAKNKFQSELESAKKEMAEVEQKLIERADLEKENQSAREKLAELNAENTALKAQMDELKTRIDRLSGAEGAVCPLCGQELNAKHREATIKQLNTDGTALGDRHRSNKLEMENLAQQIKDLEKKITSFNTFEKERIIASNKVTQINTQLETLQKSTEEWENKGKLRLVEIDAALEQETFAPDSRTQLAMIDAELKKLGYDLKAHNVVRQNESELRRAEEDFRKLENAKAALAPLEREISELEQQIAHDRTHVDRQQKDYDDAAAALAASESQAPDMATAERDFLSLQEQENILRAEVGAAQQKVSVLEDLRVRKATLESEREILSQQIGRHKQLERAFGKDGVPALLIEQALPEIETKANELLDRLSNGTMSIRFATQAEYKDKKREDLKETLDIEISDGSGPRTYEMYSGGEAFRVNFAIRLALSKVLAQRKGARLQTLVIDEGFGSQDEQGRQRLIESINMIKSDFAKILVITHLDELKDAFPNRIEVEKTDQGSTVRVI